MSVTEVTATDAVSLAIPISYMEDIELQLKKTQPHTHGYYRSWRF